MPANYVLLERIELNASAASVTFANIPQTGYTDLKVVASTRSAAANAVDALYGRFNSSSTGYTNRILYGETTGVGSFSPSISYAHLGYGVGGNGTANTFSNLEIYIPNYTSSNNKSVSVDAVTETNAANTQAGVQSFEAALWSNSAAITSITFTQESGNNFVANSTFSLYGLAAVGTTPVIAPKASGGSIYNDGTYWYHAFRSSGTFTPQTSLSCDVLVIAGGGGGGGFSKGGGGGAGGVSYLASSSLSAISYSCTVGGGGAGGANASKGASGSNSVFNSITSNGGGGAGVEGDVNGITGGSGGAGARTGTAGSANQGNTGGATGYGNAGAAGTEGTGSPATYGGGGGGGAGAAGSAALNGVGGTGGAGLNTWSSWASATSTGVSGYYAGGGGGQVYTVSTAASGAGGAGGGGAGGNWNGSVYGGGVSGTTNTGSGGGGGAPGSSYGGTPAGAGGSGIVIVRYTIA